MWSLLEASAKAEKNRGVLQACVGFLQRCAYVDPPKVARLAKKIFDRTSGGGPGAKRVRDNCINIFAGLATWHQEKKSLAVIKCMLGTPSEHGNDLRRLVVDLSSWLTEEDLVICERSFSLMVRIVDTVSESLHDLESRFTETFDKWPLVAREQYEDYLRDMDEVAQRLYFASGAFSGGNAKSRPPDANFYERTKPLYMKLAQMGSPHTAHNVINALTYLAPVDPAGVLILLGCAVRASSKYGYQYEVLGEDVIIGLVERYMAEFRSIFRERQECYAALMDILDVFVRVGWPRAHQLTYRLNEIYR
jgi:hypothetical protein